MNYLYENNEKEKKRNNKQYKKVSKYRDKGGNIKKEMQECMIFLNKIEKQSNIFDYCYKELIKENIRFKKMNSKEREIEIFHNFKRSLNKNHYNISKIYKQGMFSVYLKEDICMFMLVIREALKRKKIEEFLDIPDVFFILRQIKGIGINYYLETV